jgi:uncharacterized damage-inducible protein DinB
MTTPTVDFAYFFDYLVMARGRLLEWVREQPADVYTRTFPIGMGTIRATLLHTAGAELGYTRRLAGRPHDASNNPFTADRMPDLAPFLDAWDRQRPATREALANIGDPNRRVEYVTAAFGTPTRIRTLAGGIAGQLLFHEIHHRAQVMAMLRQAGVKAQNLDYSVLMVERSPA